MISLMNIASGGSSEKCRTRLMTTIPCWALRLNAGFNSKTTFNRIFKQMTGKSPAEYKNDLKKERPSYNLGRHQRFAAVISYHETTPRWSSEKLNRNLYV